MLKTLIALCVIGIVFLLMAGSFDLWRKYCAVEYQHKSAARSEADKNRSANTANPTAPIGVTRGKADANTAHAKSAEKGGSYKPKWSREVVCEMKVGEFFLAWFTLLLVLVTGGLIWMAASQEFHLRDTARKELRAYIALEDIYFLYKGEHRVDGANREFTPIHRIRVRNYGRTPAMDVSVWIKRSKGPIPDKGFEPSDLTKTYPEQWLGPTHRFGTRLDKDLDFHFTDKFFTYGKLIYRDIYDRWWINRFCYIYDPTGSHAPHGMWTPYGDHNREECTEKTRPY